MKALVKAKPEPGLWLEEVPEPAIGPADVKIAVRKTSICGTDLHIYRWDEWAQQTIPWPMAVGHEFMGEVTEIGEAVQGVEPGQRVSGEGHITCGHCRNCRAGRRHFCHHHLGLGVTRPGAFAEYVVIPAANVFPLPDHIGDEMGAILDPLGNATHTALAYDLVGEDVLITGAGPIGVMATAISQHIGARYVVVTDLNPYRLDMAQKLGADRVVDAASTDLKGVMDELGMSEGFDVGMEMSGSGEAFSQMIEVMNHGGRVALLGLPPDLVSVDLNAVIFKGLTLKGIYGRLIFETWYKMAALLRGGLDVESVITHRFPVAAFAEAFAVSGSGQSGKVLLEWTA
ncbi:MAG TPA: L-threonine 3-dehydrogenase [Acidimicrobiia bacterium]|nr:L-threonine 3-dehydrogenase [Acidimicrobiia bacterium]